MPALNPAMTAKLAQEIYAVVNGEKSLTDNIKYLSRVFLSAVSINETSLLAGTSGLGFIKARTVFGIAAFGVNHYHGHAFIVLRGTELNGDKLTDLNTGTSRSSTGWSVHDGFNETFQSLKHDLNPFIAQMQQQNIGSVHCIGHSLGGALVSLVAEYLQAVTRYQPYVYTFGAPRVGLSPFANHLMQEISPQKLFRVYHRTDIVPCVPFWPFVHAPLPIAEAHDYFLPSPGIVPSGAWHKMARYTQSIGRKGWGTLRGQREEPITDRQIEDWLQTESPVHFNLTHLRWLDKAIAYVVTQCATAAGIGLTMTLASGFTIMDRLAYILRKGLDLSVNLTSLVMGLLHKILSFLGLRPVVDKAEATQQFVTSLFVRLADRVNGQVQAALNQVFYSGQAL